MDIFSFDQCNPDQKIQLVLQLLKQKEHSHVKISQSALGELCQLALPDKKPNTRTAIWSFLTRCDQHEIAYETLPQVLKTYQQYKTCYQGLRKYLQDDDLEMFRLMSARSARKFKALRDATELEDFFSILAKFDARTWALLIMNVRKEDSLNSLLDLLFDHAENTSLTSAFLKVLSEQSREGSWTVWMNLARCSPNGCVKAIERLAQQEDANLKTAFFQALITPDRDFWIGWMTLAREAKDACLSAMHLFVQEGNANSKKAFFAALSSKKEKKGRTGWMMLAHTPEACLTAVTLLIQEGDLDSKKAFFIALSHADEEKFPGWCFLAALAHKAFLKAFELLVEVGDAEDKDSMLRVMKIKLTAQGDTWTVLKERDPDVFHASIKLKDQLEKQENRFSLFAAQNIHPVPLEYHGPTPR